MSFAFGIGIGTQNNQGEWLEVYYQQPIMTPDRDLIDVVETALDYKGGNQAIEAGAEQHVRVLRFGRGAEDVVAFEVAVASSLSRHQIAPAQRETVEIGKMIRKAHRLPSSRVFAEGAENEL